MRRERFAWIAILVLFGLGAASLRAGVCGLRPGVHGAGGCADPLPVQIAGTQAVRFILEHTAVADIVADPQAAAQFGAFLDALNNACIDVVITLRIPDPADGAFDTIPPAAEQPGVLSDITTFFTLFGPRIDACQIGNEIFGGPGTYRLGGRTAEQWTQPDFDTLEAWLASVAAAARDGAASAGATLGLISPALTPGLTRRGAAGVWDVSTCGAEPFCPPTGCAPACYTPDPTATRLVDFIIAFGNQYCDMVDQHLHVHCYEELSGVIGLLRQNPCGLLAATPTGLTCLEWSASHAARDWLAEPSPPPATGNNEDTMFAFLQRTEWCALDPNCPLCDPVTPAEWDTFLSGFDTQLFADTGRDLQGFVDASLAEFQATGFEHACYSTLSQLGLQDPNRLALIRQCMDVSPVMPGDLYFFDVTALRADQTVGAAGPCDPAWSNLVRAAVENGFAMFASAGCPPLPGDLTCDGVVDANDLSDWLACATGPGQRVSYACRAADLTADLSADMLDFAQLQLAASAP